ncbi:MAG: glycosyltransferase [Clostridium sp.]|jgi:cellulose synthase/poly-beta-1,6-N-acetylglucosamine synthase-like glycosyltransferase|uniref:glycosyltransferase family 2 protein n=1 Tax=Clostridium sp. TaxID=1506 RepID=UPI0025BBC7E9|nr:glycosyltransferase family 2 protein [Clostridium sp.]MCH3965904.1 glycosyltransferase [Clostridium sp.]MCI1716007.1 glycosyltransferase [Clostridium sp.]MCI1800321.1 glycosyltransferase [Clostridium sp.]MCI1814184.1 glycosyltransferase [Clostridium sp.]MCI1871083.1 glycosyltransferase [Clostridium sp.]
MENNLNKIGNRLLKMGYITRDELDIALEYQKKQGGLIGEVLVKKGFITENELKNFVNNSRYSRLGEKLLENNIITREKLEKAIRYQEENGGRIGDILVYLKFIGKSRLDNFLKVGNKKKKIPIGERLVESGKITEDQLENALELQRKSGGRLGEILVFLKYITPEDLYRDLSTQNSVGRIGRKLNFKNSWRVPYDVALKYNAIIINERENSYLLAVKDILPKSDIDKIESYLNKPVEQVLATMMEIDNFWEHVYGYTQTEKSVFELYDNQPENSAIVTFSRNQQIIILVVLLLLLVMIISNYRGAFFLINLFFQLIYAVMTLLKLFIVLKGSNRDAQLRFTEEELDEIDEKELPVYTILIPVYKEKEVIGKLIKNLRKMDYPQYKLDVCILLEKDDIETLEVLNNMDLPLNYRIIIVPDCKPKTKPKACNYGLIRARGEYLVIYDAEDRPEPDQLKKVYLSYKKLPKDFACIQAKLNYFNSSQNILTKWFTQEYSMWFELLLVGIMQLKTPIPLGGTSNHFKVNFLREVGAWDPFNVTEDADLGVRLFKKGYKTAVVDSRTWEEANSKLGNWIRQRSRWIKGYMQTWLVHMRHPVSLYKSLGFRGFVGYQAMVLGTPLLPIVNPFFWIMMAWWYMTSAVWISSLFPGIFYYIASIQFFFGNFMFTYTNTIGMYWVIRDCALKEKQPFSYGLIKYALLTPLYWFLMSVAAYKALFQLIKNPFYWEKTSHGLVSSRKDTTLNNKQKEKLNV